MDTQALVQRLVDLHGQGGLAPSASDWTAILERRNDAPVRLLNLLKFKPEVVTPEGVRSGSEAYDAYTKAVAAVFARIGAELVFRGRVSHLFSSDVEPGWDLAVLTRYPTPRSLAEFWLDPDFVRGHANRVDGVDRSLVLVFEPARRR